MKAIALLIAFCAFGARAAQTEVVTLDLARPKQPFSISFTDATATTVEARLRYSGADFDPDGWTGLLWFGVSGSAGITLTNATAAAGVMTWDVTESHVPTNGRYSVQIFGSQTNRLEEWGRGALTVYLSPSVDSLPAEWRMGDPFYEFVTNALASYAMLNTPSATNWTWTSDGAAITLTGYTGPNDVVIPDELDGLPVTGFGTIFQYDTSITSVSGGENIASIVYDAFQFCHGLLSLSLNSVTSVESGAFDFCNALASVSLFSATNIEQYAFIDSGVTSLFLAQNAPAEKTGVFEGCTPVIYVTSLTATGWGATWNGRPVVRMPVYAGSLTVAGTNIHAVISNYVSGVLLTSNAPVYIPPSGMIEYGWVVTNSTGTSPADGLVLLDGGDGTYSDLNALVSMWNTVYTFTNWTYEAVTNYDIAMVDTNQHTITTNQQLTVNEGLVTFSFHDGLFLPTGSVDCDPVKWDGLFKSGTFGTGDNKVVAGWSPSMNISIPTTMQPPFLSFSGVTTNGYFAAFVSGAYANVPFAWGPELGILVPVFPGADNEYLSWDFGTHTGATSVVTSWGVVTNYVFITNSLPMWSIVTNSIDVTTNAYSRISTRRNWIAEFQGGQYGSMGNVAPLTFTNGPSSFVTRRAYYRREE